MNAGWRVVSTGLIVGALSLMLAACPAPPPPPQPTAPPPPTRTPAPAPEIRVLPPLPADMPRESQVVPFAPLPQGLAPAVQLALGKYLFFDPSLSGDREISCASCHMPERAWTDGRQLALGYPGNLHFRNTPTLLNAAFQPLYYWDGRLGNDLSTVVRDHISEAYFMNADGALAIERLKNKPQIVALFQEAFRGEPTYGRILDSVAAYVRSLVSPPTPYDRYVAGDAAALSTEARLGLSIFQGKGGCSACHSGLILADGQDHNLGVPTNPAVFQEPLRHVVFRYFMRTHGVPNYKNLREDPGVYAMTKKREDWGKFRTPSLREVGRTAPYMHNGIFSTLEEVVEFYNRGGGDDPNKDPALVPLNLTPAERAALATFLKTLSSDPVPVEVPLLAIPQVTRLGQGN